MCRDCCHTSRDRRVFRSHPGDPLHTSTSQTRRKGSSSSTRKPRVGSPGLRWACVAEAGGEGGSHPEIPEDAMLAFSSPLSFRVLPGGIRNPQEFGEKQTQLLLPWQVDFLPFPHRKCQRGPLTRNPEAPGPASVWPENTCRALRDGGAGGGGRGVCPSRSRGVCPDISLHSPCPQMPPALECPPSAMPSLRFRALRLRVPASQVTVPEERRPHPSAVRLPGETS